MNCRAIHHHWSAEVREKLSTAAVQRFQKDLENIGHGQYSSRASRATALSPLGSNPGLEEAFYETQVGDDDDEGWTEFRKVFNSLVSNLNLRSSGKYTTTIVQGGQTDCF